MKFTLVFLVFIEILLLFVAFVKGLSNTNILFDVTQVATDAIQPGPENYHANTALDSIIKENNYTSLLYYKADFYQDIITEIQAVLAIFRSKTYGSFGPRILFSIKDVHGLRGLQNRRLFYDELLDLLSNDTLVAGVSYHAYYLESLCGANNEKFESGHPTTSIVSDMRKHILETNKKKVIASNLKLGYELHVNYLKCRDHQFNKRLADFLIVNVPITRNDVGFVESYGLFKNMLNNEIMPAILNESSHTRLFVKVSLIKTFSRDPWKAFYQNGYLTGDRKYDSYQLEWLNYAKDRLEITDSLIFARYQYLIMQYMHQWVLDNKQQNYSIILTSNQGFHHFDRSTLVDTFDNNTNVIPFASFTPITQIPDGFRVAFEMFFRDIKASGFTTLMFSAETWRSIREMDNSTSIRYKSNTSNTIKVFYYLENVDHFDSFRYDPAYIHGSAKININTIVLSNKIKFDSKNYWEEWLWNRIESTHMVTLACQISADNLISDFDLCENPICCEAIKIRSSTINNCKYFNSKSTIVIWSKTLNFTELEKNLYRLENFVNTTKKMLDSFLIAREMIFEDYPHENVIIHLKSFYDGNLSWNGGLTIYCNTYAERIGQLYEAILTWAQIHDFPIILEPSGEKHRYDHPITWTQLEVPSTNSIHELMNKIPLYIRRNHITSRSFGSWNDGMYPCIQKAMKKNTKEIKPNAFQNAGVTLRMDLRPTYTHLTAHELQVMLLFALYKFSEVEIQITIPEDLTILKDTFEISEFKENLKSNEIFGATIYLQLADIVCSKIDNNILKQVISGIKKAELKVKISVETFECLRNLKLEVSEIGLVVSNCSKEAQTLFQSPSLHNSETKWSELHYIVCVTDTVTAKNKVAKEMQDYLDSHLYLKKFFQYFYPNLKKIHFRLRSRKINERDTITSLIMFLTDVNNYAIGYDINYFLLQAFTSENNESSFWTITNYSNLTDVSNYHDQQAIYLKQQTWVPNIFIGTDQTKDIIKSSTSNTGEPSEETFAKRPINSSTFESTLVYQIVMGIGVTTFCILITVIYLIWRKSTRLTQKEIYQFRNGRTETIRRAVKERQDNQYTVNIYDGLVYQKDFEISKKYILINKKVILRKGKFTISHPATLANLDGCIVCVKISQRKCSKSAIKAMMGELKLLSYLGDHINLVRFIGCYTREIGKGVLWIVTEFCDGGSLHTYLKKKTDANISELIRVSHDIAKGMEYISNQKVIHGNLRAAVIFLDGAKTCKICGYGRLGDKMEDLIQQTKNNKPPKEWQWMAYESIKSGHFSIETDIWSFGVTVWEIFSLGDVPYANTTWDNLTDSIENGRRLEMPELASNEIRDLMMKCWTLNPKERPDFSGLVESFGSLVGKVTK